MLKTADRILFSASSTFTLYAILKYQLYVFNVWVEKTLRLKPLAILVISDNIPDKETRMEMCSSESC